MEVPVKVVKPQTAIANSTPIEDRAMNKDIEYAVRAQLGMAEDNLCRAKAAARRADPTKPWGESGQTLQEIIGGYEAEVRRWKAALLEA
jgi:hypothetical protein